MPAPEPTLSLRPRRGRILLLASGPVGYLVAWLLRLAPSAVEGGFARGLGPALSWPLSRLTGALPFSVAELLVVLFVGRQLQRLVLAPWREPRGMRRRALADRALAVTSELSLVVALFYVLWGWHYSRAPLPERWEWESAGSAQYETMLSSLAEETVAAANTAYLELHGVEDAEVPTQVDDPRRHAYEQALGTSFRRLRERAALEPAVGWRWGRPKRLLMSPLLHRLGISGFYFPWTGEANLNRSVPAVSAAHALAHESAHQRGIARENEANFVGFLAGWTSGDPWGRYGAAVFAQRQILFALARRDPDRARSILEQRLPGVQRDVDDLRAYWDRHRGPLRSTARRVNHAYLRGNRVEGGVASYGRSLTLLLEWAASRGGQLEPPAAP